jgi:hypothetical protein
MAVERRFIMGTWQTSPSDDDDPGIIIKSDGSVAVVDSAGDEPLVVGTGTISMVLPTSDPAVAGQLWANAGVVTVSAG